MHQILGQVTSMEFYEKIPAGMTILGVCILTLGFTGMVGGFAELLTLVIGVSLLTLATLIYSTYSPSNQRFELGTRSAEHQYGPISFETESTIEYAAENENLQQNSGMKLRTVECEAFTDDGENIASATETQAVGSRPLSIFAFLEFAGGDRTDVQSTERHVREVTSKVKENALERIATGGDDPELKAALETELGEEFHADEADKTENQETTAVE